MGDDVLKKFGRYFLLDRIAQGGMAEIFRSRLASADGAGRLLVIKKISTGFKNNDEFTQMFKDEIKVTMGFNHPNVVQLYDFGEEHGAAYIAMEFIDGKNLRQVAVRFLEQNQKFPIELAVHVTEQAAAGLHYAHSFKDRITGQPLNIVHRDVSPQNIIVSYDGAVKVIDFGIAKATTSHEDTEAGVIKGKLSYLSPEQISGQDLDGRSDIFALGIVLWEILTGKKLFSAPGENEFAVLKMIESCQTYVKPPSTINPEVPKELDYIVLRALAKQPSKRYQTAEDLQRALHKFLYSFSTEFNPQDLSYTAKQLFKNEIVEDRKGIQRLSTKAETLLQSGQAESVAPLNATSVASAPAATPVPTPAALPSAEVKSPARKTETTFPQEVAEKTLTSLKSPPSATPAVAAKAGPAAPQIELVATRFTKVPQAAGMTSSTINKPNPSPQSQTGLNRPSKVQSVSQSPPGQTRKIAKPGEETKSKRSLFVIAAGIAAAFFVYTQFSESEKPMARAPSSVEVEQQPREAPATSIASKGKPSVLLKLDVQPRGLSGVRIQVNGALVSESVSSISVPLDEPLELSADRSGFKSFRSDFVLEARDYAGKSETVMEVKLEPKNYGFLSVKTNPSAEIELMGADEATMRVIPVSNPLHYANGFEDEKLPAGNYLLKMENKILGMSKQIAISISEGKRTSIEERLDVK